MRLTEERQKTVLGQVGPKPQGGRPEGGVRAAARELPVPGETEEARRHNVRRAVKIASLTPEAKQAAKDAALDDNQSALLKAAAKLPEEQVGLSRRSLSKPAPVASCGLAAIQPLPHGCQVGDHTRRRPPT